MNCSKPKNATGRGRGQMSAAVILAASRGSGMKELTRERPKVMLEVAGKPVLRRLVEKFKEQGINRITVVAGYRHEAIDTGGVDRVVNEDWETGGELTSLDCAANALGGDAVIIYGDLLFRGYILSHLMDWEAEILAVVDSSPLASAAGNVNDLAWCTAPDDRAMYQQKVSLTHVQSAARDEAGERGEPDGRWIGMLRVSGAGVDHLREAIDHLKQKDDWMTLGMPDLINQLIEDGHPPQVQYINGHWMDINRLEDLQRAGEFGHDRGREQPVIEARDFLEPARAAGFTTWSGVPCSFLTPFINAVISDPGLQYVAAANEGDAVAVASGAALGGAARRRHHAELGPGQCGQPSEFTELGVSPAGPAHRHATGRAGRRGRTPA